jgi:hypothetical protein
MMGSEGRTLIPSQELDHETTTDSRGCDAFADGLLATLYDDSDRAGDRIDGRTSSPCATTVELTQCSTA